MDDVGCGFGGWSEIVKGEREEYGEESDECGAFPSGRSGTVQARVNDRLHLELAVVVVVVVHLERLDVLRCFGHLPYVRNWNWSERFRSRRGLKMNSSQEDEENVEHEHESGEFIFKRVFFLHILLFLVSSFQRLKPFAFYYYYTDMELSGEGSDVDMTHDDNNKLDDEDDTGIDPEEEDDEDVEEEDEPEPEEVSPHGLPVWSTHSPAGH